MSKNTADPRWQYIALKLPHGTRWGNWVLTSNWLTFTGGYYRQCAYHVPLDELRTDEGRKKWTDHLEPKCVPGSAFTPNAIADFKQAVRDLFCYAEAGR